MAVAIHRFALVANVRVYRVVEGITTESEKRVISEGVGQGVALIQTAIN